MRKLLSVILWSALMIVSMPLSMKAGRADYRVIPLPQSIQTDTTKVFTLQAGMTIAYDAGNAEVSRTAQMLCQWVEQQTGLRLQLAPSAKKPAVRLAVSPASLASSAVSAFPAKKGTSAVSGFPADNYSLTVTKTGITIAAAEPIGLFRGVQTLRKSLPTTDGPVELRLRCVWQLTDKSRITQDIVFDAASPLVTFDTVMDWQEDHRFLKTAFDTSIFSDFVRQDHR